MSINLKAPELRELKPRIMVCGVGGAGGNAVNNMIVSGLSGVDFIVANTDAQALTSSRAERIIQMGLQVTEGLGAGSKPEVGKAAAEEALEEIRDHLAGAHMVFVTAGMGGGTGTGAAPVIARAARELGILTVGVVTKPFHFEGGRRMKVAETGISDLQKAVDTLIIIPNQNLFRVANEKTTFADAFAMADQVLYSGVACITDLMVKEGLINLDFADVRSIMSEMGKAMMGTGEAAGDKRAVQAAEAAIANPLLDETSMRGARGLLISITGGNDLTLYEVDEAASRPTSSSAPLSIRRSTGSCAFRSWPPASIRRRSDRSNRSTPCRGRMPSRARGPSRPARLARLWPRLTCLSSPRRSAARRTPPGLSPPSPSRSRPASKPTNRRRRNSFRPPRSSRWPGRPACRRSRTCRNWRRTNCARCARGSKTPFPRPKRAAGRYWRNWPPSASRATMARPLPRRSPRRPRRQ
jgi:cell division protein FtsZ